MSWVENDPTGRHVLPHRTDSPNVICRGEDGGSSARPKAGATGRRSLHNHPSGLRSRKRVDEAVWRYAAGFVGAAAVCQSAHGC